MKTEKAVEVVTPKPLAVVQPEAASQQEVMASDVLIPRLLLMQGLSPLVISRKAQLGDFVRSTTGEILGNPEKSVDLVPICMVNTWINFEVPTGQGQQKPKFKGTEKRTAANEHLEWEYISAQGVKCIRRKAIGLFALLPSDVAKNDAEFKKAIASGEAPDLSKNVMPVMISFQSTSFKHGGKKCASFFNAVRMASAKYPGVAPYMYTIPLTCREEKNEKGQFYIFDLGLPMVHKNAPLSTAGSEWYLALSASNPKVDEAEMDTEVDTDSSSVHV